MNTSDRPEPWWPLQWDKTWPLFAVPTGHPTIVRVAKGVAGSTLFLVDNGDHQKAMYDVALKIDTHDDLAIRCTLLALAYPEGNDENAQEA